MAKTDWKATTRQILDSLDIRSEYASLGVDITGSSASSKGWVSCRAFGREDRNPSAAINVGDGVARGRYHDHGGLGLSLGLFDFAAMFGPHEDWKAARRHYAEKAGIKLPRGRQPEDSLDKFKWQPWNDNLARAWCLKKPPIAVETLKRCGAKLAKWSGQQVITLPIYGSHLTDADPVGYVAWNRTGRDLAIYQGENAPPAQAKTITPRHKDEDAVWVGQYGAGHLADAEVVWKVEGVTDLLALQGLIPAELLNKHVVVTNSNGCNETPNQHQVDSVAGKIVYVLHDADEPGQGVPKNGQDAELQLGAKKWCSALATTAAEVRNVQLPYSIAADHGKDLRDWVAEGHSYQELIDLAVASEPVDTLNETEPEIAETLASQLHGEKAALAAIELEVLGELPGGRIKVFSTYHHKIDEIYDISRLSYDQLLRICGIPAKEKVLPVEPKENIPGMYTLSQIKNAIGLIAGFRRVSLEHEVGQGVWEGQEEEGDKQKPIIIVGAGESILLNGEVTIIKTPRSHGLLLDIGSSKPWYDKTVLARYLKMALEDAQWRRETIREAEALFARWSWKHQEISPPLVVGLIMATWIETLWDWRPHVAIIGESNSGKSYLFDSLGYIFGELSVKSSSSTEAGIRQTVSNNASAILCDEFESSKHRQKVMEMLRASSRGDTVLRGTASGGASRRFILRHIAWVTAIEVGMHRQPDRNRFIVLELVKPAAEDYGKLELPDEDSLVDLGQRLLAISLVYAPIAKVLAKRLKRENMQGVNPRVVESYSVPTAILSCPFDAAFESAVSLMRDCLLGADSEEQNITDHDECLEDILNAQVDIGRGDRLTVAQILRSQSDLANYRDILEAHGITLALGRRGSKGEATNPMRYYDYLFVVSTTTRRRLLKGTQWESQAIEQILGRIPGAVKSKPRVIAGQRRRGVDIPMEYVTETHIDFDDEDELI